MPDWASGQKSTVCSLVPSLRPGPLKPASPGDRPGPLTQLFCHPSAGLIINGDDDDGDDNEDDEG